MSITSRAYGKLPSGKEVSLFTLTNTNGLRAEIMDYGASLVSLHVPDRDGDLADIVLGKDSLDEYVAGHPCFGSTCGRVAGRIGGGTFKIDGKTHTLETNDAGINNLHGGPEGFPVLPWSAQVIDDFGVAKLVLSLTTPDGHNDFPGANHCTVLSALLANDCLDIHS